MVNNVGIAVFVKADKGGLVGFDGLDLVDAREGIGRGVRPPFRSPPKTPIGAL